MQISKEYVGLNQSQIKVIFDTINETVDSILSNYDDVELDCLKKCIEPISVYSIKDVIERLQIRALIPITHGKGYDERIKLSAMELRRCIQENKTTFSDEQLSLLMQQPNTNPFNLLAMQDFTLEIEKFNNDLKPNLYRLREIFFEMTPLGDHSMGSVNLNGEEIRIYQRIGTIPMNLNHFGPTPKYGEIRGLVTKIVEHSLEFDQVNEKRITILQLKSEKEKRELRLQLQQRDKLIEQLTHNYNQLRSIYQGDKWLPDDVLQLLRAKITSTKTEILGYFNIGANLLYLKEEIERFIIRLKFSKQNNLPSVENLVIVLEFDYLSRGVLVLNYSHNDLSKANHIAYFDPMGGETPIQIKQLFSQTVQQIRFTYQIPMCNKDILLIESVVALIETGELTSDIDFEALRKEYDSILQKNANPIKAENHTFEKNINEAIIAKTISTNNPIDINTSYCYDDRDIELITNTFIYRYLGGYAKNHRYLLKNQYHEESNIIKQQYYLVVTPPVGASEKHMPIGYFLDSTLQPSNIIIECLKKLLLLNVIQTFESLDESRINQCLGLYLENQVDEFIILRLIQLLKTLYFKPELVKQYVEDLEKQTEKCDVFDEIMPIILKNEQSHIKILFSYNDKLRFHWLLAEIILHSQGKNQYQINVFSHDPRGLGIMSESHFNSLQSILVNQILKWDSRAQVTIINENSPYTARQSREDYTDCGVIVCDDMFKRIQGQSLNLSQTYPVGAKQLRLYHFELVRQFSVCSEKENFLKRVVKLSHSLKSFSHQDAQTMIKTTTSKLGKFILPDFVGDSSKPSKNTDYNNTRRFQEWINEAAFLAVREGNQQILEFLITKRNFLEHDFIDDWKEYERMQIVHWKSDFLYETFKDYRSMVFFVLKRSMIVIQLTMEDVKKHKEKNYTHAITQYENLLKKEANVICVNGKLLFTHKVDNSIDSEACHLALDYYKRILKQVVPLCDVGKFNIRDINQFYKQIELKTTEYEDEYYGSLMSFNTFELAFFAKREQAMQSFLASKRKELIELIKRGFFILPNVGQYSETDPVWNFIIEKYLINASVDETLCDNNKNSLLHLAVKYGYVDMALYLVQFGSEIFKMKNNNSLTPFQVRDNQSNTLLHYCLASANRNLSLYEKRPKKRYVDVAYDLVNLGADVNAENESGMAAIDVTDEHGDTILHHTIRDGLYTLTMHLLSHKASLIKPNKKGETPWDIIFDIENDHLREEFLEIAMISILYKALPAKNVSNPENYSKNENKKWSLFQKDVFRELDNYLHTLSGLKERSWIRTLIDYTHGITEQTFKKHREYVRIMQRTLVHAHLKENDSMLIQKIDSVQDLNDYRFLALHKALVGFASEAKINPLYARLPRAEENQHIRKLQNISNRNDGAIKYSNVLKEEQENQRLLKLLSRSFLMSERPEEKEKKEQKDKEREEFLMKSLNLSPKATRKSHK